MAYIKRTVRCGRLLFIDKYHTARYNKRSLRGSNRNETSEEQKRINVRHSARKRVLKACANFPKGSKFIRLSYYDGERPDGIDEAHKIFCAFIKKIKRKLPDMKYMGVTEEGSRGGLHHHLLVGADFDLGLAEQLWRGGIYKGRVYSDDISQLASYLTKGECGDIFGETREHKERRKKYTQSRNLIMPEEKKEIIKKADHWTEAPSSITYKGHIYDVRKGSVWNGFTKDGYEYQCYVMIMRE